MLVALILSLALCASALPIQDFDAEKVGDNNYKDAFQEKCPRWARLTWFVSDGRQVVPGWLRLQRRMVCEQEVWNEDGHSQDWHHRWRRPELLACFCDVSSKRPHAQLDLHPRNIKKRWPFNPLGQLDAGRCPTLPRKQRPLAASCTTVNVSNHSGPPIWNLFRPINWFSMSCFARLAGRQRHDHRRCHVRQLRSHPHR